MSEEGENHFWRSIRIVMALLSVIWVVQFLQYFHIYDFSDFANHPRHLDGLKGILFSPFVHDPEHFDHIVSNTLPMLVLMTVLLNAYPRMAITVLVFVHLVSGVLVWTLARSNSYHVGISGIVYGIAAFLIASGIFRKDSTSVAIALFVTLVYGGMVVGFLPTRGISWESHLYGAVSGIIIAFIYRRTDLPKPTEIEIEKLPEERHFFDIPHSDPPSEDM